MRTALTAVILGLAVGIPGRASAQRTSLDQVERLVESGAATEARGALERWEREFGAEAGPEERVRAWYLAGRLAEAGAEAELYYLKVAIEGSSSSYADDGLLLLAQYQFARGEHVRGIDYLSRLRRDYPTSEHAAAALLWIARGARALGDEERACVAAEQGLREVMPGDTAASRGLAAARAPCDAAAGGYSVQVAALSDGEAAQNLSRQLFAQGYDAWVLGPEQGEGLYRVRVGRGLATPTAQTLVERLVAVGYSPFLVSDRSTPGGGR